MLISLDHLTVPADQAKLDLSLPGALQMNPLLLELTVYLIAMTLYLLPPRAL